MSKPFKFRGHNTFYFKRKRHKLPSLRSMMAQRLACLPRVVAGWSGETGNGKAWADDYNRFGKWMRVRVIKGGQWSGPWKYEIQ